MSNPVLLRSSLHCHIFGLANESSGSDSWQLLEGGLEQGTFQAGNGSAIHANAPWHNLLPRVCSVTVVARNDISGSRFPDRFEASWGGEAGRATVDVGFRQVGLTAGLPPRR